MRQSDRWGGGGGGLSAQLLWVKIWLGDLVFGAVCSGLSMFTNHSYCCLLKHQFVYRSVFLSFCVVGVTLMIMATSYLETPPPDTIVGAGGGGNRNFLRIPGSSHGCWSAASCNTLCLGFSAPSRILQLQVDLDFAVLLKMRST